jgi:hypothetical protein
VKLYLAEGKTWTLVTRRSPSVSVPSDFFEVGSVVIVRPRSGSDTEMFATPRARRLLRRGGEDEGHFLLTSREDRDDLRRAADAAVLVQHEWPSVRNCLGLDDPGPTLADALWDLAGVLAERATVQTAVVEFAWIQPQLPQDSSIGKDMAETARKAAAKLDQLDQRVTARLVDLSRLADETEAFVHQQTMIEHARSVIRNADFLENIDDASTADNTKDLAEQTSAVLAAYRELTQ